MNIEIDYDKLREDLLDYYGTAYIYNPIAIIEFSNAQNASNSKLIQIAQKKVLI